MRDSRWNSKKGQVRVIELIIALSMVVSIILLVMFFTRPMRSPYLRETVDLRRLGFNLLNQLADVGAFERLISDALQGDTTWEGRMRMLLSASLPSGIVFHMRIYEVQEKEDGSLKPVPIDNGGITNAAPNLKLLESEAIHFTYVCVKEPDRVRGKILYIVLVIGYAG